jgi:hypothetical protein
MNYTEIVKKAVDNANAGVSKLPREVLDLEGMSSNRIRHLLNNIISLQGNSARYLEVGVWKGSTTISALYNNTLEYHTCIDNFTQFNGPRIEFQKNCRTHLSYENRVNFLDCDCFEINPADFNIKDINTYLYDGEHSAASQYRGITHYYESLANEFILIVDDFNWEEVQRGTRDAIRDKNIKVQYEVHLPAYPVTTQGQWGPEIAGDKINWWNGYYVAHCTK